MRNVVKSTNCCLLFVILFSVYLISCKQGNFPKEEKPYTVSIGAYEYEKGIFTNLFTNETKERSFDDIIMNKGLYRNWGHLLGLSVRIHEDTEFTLKDDRWYVIDEALAYELVADDTLKLHFSNWRACDYMIYDIVIYLGRAKIYG